MSQGSDWVTVGGTYTASADCQCVSFSLWVEIDDDNDNTEAYDGTTLIGTHDSSNLYPALAVDFVYCASQSFTADMAEQITASRVYTVQQDLETNIETLEDNLGAESDSLMPNGNFLQKFTDSSIDYVQKWLPTGSGSADKLRLYDADSASKSIGTYVKFNKSTSGGIAPYGTSISGIISKAILNPIEMVTDPSGNINAFNIGLRIRGTTDTEVVYSENTTITDAQLTGIRHNSSANSPQHYTSYTAGVGTINFDQADVTYTVDWAQYVVDAIMASDGDAFNCSNLQGVDFPIQNTSLEGSSSFYIVFGMSSINDDSSRYIQTVPRDGSSNVANSVWGKKSIYYSLDGGSSWTEAQSESTSSLWYHQNTFYNRGSFSNEYLVAVVFQKDPNSNTAVYGRDFDTIRVYTGSTSGNTFFSKGAYARYVG